MIIIKHGPGDYGVVARSPQDKVHVFPVQWFIGADKSIEVIVGKRFSPKAKRFYFGPESREACRQFLQAAMGYDDMGGRWV